MLATKDSLQIANDLAVNVMENYFAPPVNPTLHIALADHAKGHCFCLRFGHFGNAHRGVHPSQRR
ncbi:hypothetical protein sync_1141 [Synechococcus sp. CC9311]|nr:hypothetical protein sync_1141 [Synechococcus sp. CC9311]